MAGKQLEATVALFRAYIREQKWVIIQEKTIQNGLQLLVTDGEMRTSVACFTNGNALIQGAEGSLKAQLQTWWNQQKMSQFSLQGEENVRSPVQQRKINAFRDHARAQEWSCVGKEIHQGIYQLRLVYNTMTVPVNFYPTGTVLVQGKPSDLRRQVEQWWNQQSSATTTPLWESAPLVAEVIPGDKNTTAKDNEV